MTKQRVEGDLKIALAAMKKHRARGRGRARHRLGVLRGRNAARSKNLSAGCKSSV
jgi:hypothetical protein